MMHTGECRTIPAVQEAREGLAARLERLARRVRAGQTDTPAMEAMLDAAYADVVKIAWTLREALGA
jgi:hypothetical protein